MFLTRDTDVATVCVVVCVRFMTGVPDAGLSPGLWRLSTSNRMWVRVYNTVANGAEPVRNVGNDVLVYTMTSVGLDLWVFGGNLLIGTTA